MIRIEGETREELLKQVRELFQPDELDGGHGERVRKFMAPLMVRIGAYDRQRISDVKLKTVDIPDLWAWLFRLHAIAMGAIPLPPPDLSVNTKPIGKGKP